MNRRRIVSIGHCMGCTHMAKLDGGVCLECLTNASRGRRWAEMSHHCRTDREFAGRVFAHIYSDRGREVFTLMYGDPRASEVTGAPPVVPTRRHGWTSSRRALVEALAARSVFDHPGFVSALTTLTKGRALRRVDVVELLAAEAHGFQAVELVAVLAGRWVHAMRPDLGARRRVAEPLIPKACGMDLEAASLASLLTLDPSDDLWLALTVRMREPPFLAFDMVRSEMARSPHAMSGSLASAAKRSAQAREWWHAARGVVWPDSCGCADCALPAWQPRLSRASWP